jgi:hypothetical protein
LAFPGFVEVDIKYILGESRAGQLHSFQGPIYSLLINFFDIVNMNFYVLCLMHVLLSYYIYISLEQKFSLSKYKVIQKISLLNPVLFVSPLFLGIVYFVSRDSLLALATTAFFIYFERNKDKLKNYYIATFVFYFICSLRQESIAMFLLFPPTLFVFGIVKYKQLLKLQLLVVLMVAGSAILFQDVFGRDHRRTAVLNPLAQIINSPNLKNIDENDLKIIDQNISVECIKKEYYPLNIMPLHKGCFKNSVTSEKVFFGSVSNIFINNVDTIINNRINLFINSTNFIKNNGLIIQNEYELLNWKTLEPRTSTKPDSSAIKFFNKLMTQISSQNDFYRIAAYSLLIPIVILLLVLLKKDANPILKLFYILILIRCIITFVFAPAAYFKYYHILYFFSWCGFLFYLAELKLIRNKNAE